LILFVDKKNIVLVKVKLRRKQKWKNKQHKIVNTFYSRIFFVAETTEFKG
jgi:hypothetical protein